MATYAIGDIQGCFDSLLELLEYVQFDRRHDRVWLVGDLVNRGPKSLEVLRWARDLGDAAVAVLGNHDLHLLMCAAGVQRVKKRDTLARVLKAHDCDELLDWLRRRPVLHVEGGRAMVHAGLHPAWTMEVARQQGDELCALLRADDWRERIDDIASKKPPPWSLDLKPKKRLQAVASVFCSLRTCRLDGSLCTDFKGSVVAAPEDCIPWFLADQAKWRGHQVIFGHWATLGLFQNQHVLGLDTGCVWGGALTAYRLEDGEFFQMPAVEAVPVPLIDP